MQKRFDGPAKLNMVAAVNLVLYGLESKQHLPWGA